MATLTSGDSSEHRDRPQFSTAAATTETSSLLFPNSTSSHRNVRTPTVTYDSVLPREELWEAADEGILPPVTGERDAEEEEEEEEENESVASAHNEIAILALMQRLRFLFGLLTFPIVPLAIMAVVTLVWFLGTALLLDNAGSPRRLGVLHDTPRPARLPPCAHPLHAYAEVSLLLALYVPYHLSSTGPRARFVPPNSMATPRSLRRCHQIAKALALVYVYAGIALLQACDADPLPEGTTVTTLFPKAVLVVDGGAGGGEAMAATIHDTAIFGGGGGGNSCQATCPALTQSLTYYVATLELLILAMLLPLVCLPCVYLWMLRYATTTTNFASTSTDPQTLAGVLQDHYLLRRHNNNDDDDDTADDDHGLRYNHRRHRSTVVTAGEILQQLRSVRLVRDYPNVDSTGINHNEDDDDDDNDDHVDGKVRIVSLDDSGCVIKAKCNGALECCICMSDFYIGNSTEDNNDVEVGYITTAATMNENDAIVQTPTCGHLFHKNCIASWVGGRWEQQRRQIQQQHQQQQQLENDSNSTPRPNAGRTHPNDDDVHVVVGGVGDTTDNNNNTEGSAIWSANHLRVGRQRRARRTTCPLCRADLRRTSSGGGGGGRGGEFRTRYNTF